MKKAVMLNVRVWVEGEDEPAHDFAATAIESIRKVLAGRQRDAAPKLFFTVKNITEDYSADDDSTEADKDRF